MKKSVILVAAFLGVISVSCGGSKQEKPKTETETETVAQDTAEVKSQFVLPSTVQVGQIFQDAGLSYVSGVTNDPSSVSVYNTKVDKLLNYGIYSTDLSYCILNNQNEESQKYLMAVKTLSDDLGLSEIYESDDLFERFKKAIGDEKAILDMMIEIQEKTDSYIDDNEFQSEALVIFTGAWVEGMYIGVKASDPKNEHHISARLLEQMTVLDNMLNGLDVLKVKSKKLTDVKERLHKMQVTFENLEEVKNFKNYDGEFNLSMDNMVELANQIVDLRTVIVN